VGLARAWQAACLCACLLPATLRAQDAAVVTPEDRVHTILGVSSGAAVVAGNTLAMAGSAILTVVGSTLALNILARPLTLATGSIPFPTLPGGVGGPVGWKFSTVELSVVLAIVGVSLAALGLAGLSTAMLLGSANTVYPQKNTNGLWKVLLRVVALHGLSAALLAGLSTPLLVFPAAFSLAFLFLPGSVPQVSRSLANFWGPTLVVVALVLLGSAAVGGGLGLDLLLTSQFVGD
jgi:hypothetical protein